MVSISTQKMTSLPVEIIRHIFSFLLDEPQASSDTYMLTLYSLSKSLSSDPILYNQSETYWEIRLWNSVYVQACERKQLENGLHQMTYRRAFPLLTRFLRLKQKSERKRKSLQHDVEMWNLVVLGEGGVGKTSIVTKFVNYIYNEMYSPTIEDSYRKQISVDEKVTMVEVLDTAGLFHKL